MSERKVLNKYYPPDFDPTKIPKLKQGRNRQYTIRIMAPFNMRCNLCGEYIYKGKKFNSRKETVEDQTYLGLYIFRFYIKCPRCVAEIAFKTDPQNTDYELEDGATRNFEASKTAEIMARKEQKEIEDEELNNPMKVLENRTKASQREMEMIETLEELKELNSRQARTDHDSIIKLHNAYKEQLKKLQDEDDEKFVQSLFGKSGESSLKRLQDDDGDDDDAVPVKTFKSSNPTDILTKKPERPFIQEEKPVWKKSVGSLGKDKLGMLVKKKQSTTGAKNSASLTATVASSEKLSDGPNVNGKSSGNTPEGKSPAAWEKSVGSLGKGKLGMLVKKKQSTAGVKLSTSATVGLASLETLSDGQNANGKSSGNTPEGKLDGKGTDAS